MARLLDCNCYTPQNYCSCPIGHETFSYFLSPLTLVDLLRVLCFFCQMLRASFSESLSPVYAALCQMEKGCWKSSCNMWVFPKIGIPQNGWFTMENPIKMDDLGVPLFLETPMCCATKDVLNGSCWWPCSCFLWVLGDANSSLPFEPPRSLLVCFQSLGIIPSKGQPSRL